MIELIGFSKVYKSAFSKKNLFKVEDLSFKVEDASVTALIGANGSGKTTIIKGVCAFHYPDSGKIYLSDSNGNKFDISENPEKAMELIGYVPEKTLLPQDMYVKEFLLYCSQLHNFSKTQEKEAVERVIEDCSLQEILDKKIKNLSKGFGQRLSFAQALIHNPQNLILDEPVTGLDPSQIISMRKLIEKNAKSKAILLSTHILQEVSSLCKNLCVMKNGKLVASGSESQIIADTGSNSLEEAFLKLTEKGASQ
ncbi:MAG: ABC transporter ATP-binding protein [Treponema sp.]|nr:ABC transporter ATP-binding protein [Treponema sp.]